MAEIRAAQAADLDAIQAIEAVANPHPWSRTSLASSLEDAASIGFVAVVDDAVRGFVLARAVLDEAEVLEIAVHPVARRRGVARGLLDALTSALASRGVVTLHLEVRRGNHGARALYEGLGFASTGERAGYYADPVEDAVLMSRSLDRAHL